MPDTLPTDVDLIIDSPKRTITLRFEDEAAMAAGVRALNGECNERVVSKVAPHIIVGMDPEPKLPNKVCHSRQKTAIVCPVCVSILPSSHRDIEALRLQILN